MYNYGQLQVTFDDGSVGWYEAGLGTDDERDGVLREGRHRPEGMRVDREGPERGDRRRVRRHRQPHEDEPHPLHHGATRRDATIRAPDEFSAPRTSPITRASATASRRFLLRAIHEDLDLTDHMKDAVNSLRIVLAADESVRTGQVVTL